MSRAEYERQALEQFRTLEAVFVPRQRAAYTNWLNAESLWKLQEDRLSDATLREFKKTSDEAEAAFREQYHNDTGGFLGSHELTSKSIAADRARRKFEKYFLKSGSKDLLEAALSYHRERKDFYTMKQEEQSYMLRKKEKEFLGHPLLIEASADDHPGHAHFLKDQAEVQATPAYKPDQEYKGEKMLFRNAGEMFEFEVEDANNKIEAVKREIERREQAEADKLLEEK